MARVRVAESQGSTRRVVKSDNLTLSRLTVPRAFQGFVDFIRHQGVVALAVGIFLGADAKTVIDSIVNNLVNPIIGILTGNINLNNEAVCIKHAAGVCKSSLGYGAVISTIISFIIAAFIVYLIIRALKLDQFDKKEKED